MASTISFNPNLTTTAAGSFNATSTGYIQGTTLDQPAARYSLSGGILATTETYPMWGGVGISEVVPSGISQSTLPGSGFSTSLGGQIIRANSVASASSGQQAGGILTGFSVFDQNYASVNWPQSPVPTVGSGGMVNFYRIGSGARIAVAVDPVLVDIEGYGINSLVSWDFINQCLQPYDASTATYALTSMTYTATGASGGPGFVVVAAVATLVGAVGDVINVSGATGNLTANGSFVVTSFTDSQHFTVAAPHATSGSVTGSPVINAGTGALNVRVLEVQIGNSMTVNWDSTNNVATWNRNGSTAIILI
jgi:hypothetical protein